MIKLTFFYAHVLDAAGQNKITVDEVLKQAVASGISGIEMDYLDLKKGGDELASHLREMGTPISCVYHSFDWVNNPTDDSYVTVLNDLKRNDIPNFLVIPGFTADPRSIGIQDTDTYFMAAQEKTIPNMKALLTLAKELDITVRMEDFDGIQAPFATMGQVKWYLDTFPELECAFDTGNFLYSEEDALEAYDLLKDRITYVHCKDRSLTPALGENPQVTTKGRNIYSAPVGHGIIPMEQILNNLINDGYLDRDLSVFAIEHFGSPRQLDYMITSAEYLCNKLK